MGRPKTDADPVTKNDPSEIDASVKIKILLDSPSDAPTKSMKDAAAVLAKLILDSSPRFSVGVFGGWGSGKTTLMRAIHRELRRDISTIPVEFSGWRFEREPQLLVPLLDTIRMSLVSWSNKQKRPELRERVASVARRIGRVVRALLAGLSGEVGLPGGAV